MRAERKAAADRLVDHAEEDGNHEYSGCCQQPSSQGVAALPQDGPVDGNQRQCRDVARVGALEQGAFQEKRDSRRDRDESERDRDRPVPAERVGGIRTAAK